MSTPRSMIEAARGLRQGRFTPVDLATRCLDRIKRLDAGAQAWFALDAPGAMQAAERLAAELAMGHDRGALHGIPIGVKDIFDVEGLPTRAGSSLTDPQAAVHDATVVRRLREAGAVILGKTVTTEFACFDPPPTLNPWNARHTPGGSSSGSAAAVALGMCYGALASQTGGSVTRPASYCGVAGCKPTFGLVSRRGVMPVSFHLDQVGVMAATAADCAVLLAAMCGDDPLDPAASPGRVFDLSENTLRPPSRLGVPSSYFFDTAEAETAALARRAIAMLSDRGAELIELPLPDGFEHVHAMHRRLMVAEGARFHQRTHGAPRSGYGPEMSTFIQEGLATSMADYQEALEHQVQFRHAMARSLADVDALVTPATPGPAPASLTTTGDPRFNSPWSLAGLPTVSIPCAVTAAGLPIALQFIGHAWSDARLLAIASCCEEQLGFRFQPPMLNE